MGLAMNPAHLHLVVVHVPIVLAPVGLLLLLAAAWRQNRDLQMASLLLLLTVGIASGVSYNSGPTAAEWLDNLNQPSTMSGLLQGQHQEMAEVATLISLFLGLLSLAGWARPQSRRLLLAQIIVAALASGALAYTGYLGGQIRHSEIRATQPTNRPVVLCSSVSALALGRGRLDVYCRPFREPRRDENPGR